MKIMTERYRIEGRQNVYCNGRKTRFKLYVLIDGSYIYRGTYNAHGWDASEERCITAALREL